MATTSVLILGATGYLGGTVLVSLQAAHPNFKYSAIIRKEEFKPALEKMGVSCTIGSFHDFPLVTELSSKADIVINMSDADDLELAKAILSGLKQQQGKSQPPIYIHTSGSALVCDWDANGSFTKWAERVWTDNEDEVKEIAPTALHRNVDDAVFAANNEGYVRAWIIAPSTIYGKGIGPGRKMSLQIPCMIRTALSRREVVYIGEGTNVWGMIHVEDCADLYVLVFNHAISAPADPSKTYQQFFYCCSEDYSWKSIAENIAPIMYKLGKVDSPTPKSVPQSDDVRMLYLFTSSNSRVKPVRGLSWGWKPKRKLADHFEEDVLATLEGEN